MRGALRGRKFAVSISTEELSPESFESAADRWRGLPEGRMGEFADSLEA